MTPQDVIEKVQVMELIPGDKILVSFGEEISPDKMAEVGRLVRDSLPDYEVYTLAPGLEIKVIREVPVGAVPVLADVEHPGATTTG